MKVSKIILLGWALVFLFAGTSSATLTKGKNNSTMRYGETINFTKDQLIHFPDFSIQYLGMGVSTSHGKHVAILTHYFRIKKGHQENIIRWSSGTGSIGPMPFEFKNHHYYIEMAATSYDPVKKKMGNHQKWLKKNQFVIWKVSKN